MRTLAILLASVLLLTSCVEKITPSQPEGTVHQIPAIEWRIVSEEELVRVYQLSDKTVPEGAKLHGFIGTKPNGKYVLYTLAPKNVDDDVTTTLGHEVIHSVLGDYHK